LFGAAITQATLKHQTCCVAAIFFCHTFCVVFPQRIQHIAILSPLCFIAVAKSCANSQKPNKKTVTPAATTVPLCQKKNVGS
jgi:hypothetical protein